MFARAAFLVGLGLGTLPTVSVPGSLVGGLSAKFPRCEEFNHPGGDGERIPYGGTVVEIGTARPCFGRPAVVVVRIVAGETTEIVYLAPKALLTEEAAVPRVGDHLEGEAWRVGTVLVARRGEELP